MPPRSVALSNCFCLRAVSLLVPFSPYRARFARHPLPQGRRGEVCDPRSADGARRGGDGGRGSGCGGVERVRRLQTQRQHFSSVRRRRVLEHPADAALLLLMPVCRRRRVDGVLLVLHGFLNKSSQGRIIERRGKRKNVLLLTFVCRLRASEEKAERAQNEEQGKEIFRSLSLSQSLFALSASVGARLDASVLAFLSLFAEPPRAHLTCPPLASTACRVQPAACSLLPLFVRIHSSVDRRSINNSMSSSRRPFRVLAPAGGKPSSSQASDALTVNGERVPDPPGFSAAVAVSTEEREERETFSSSDRFTHSFFLSL